MEVNKTKLLFISLGYSSLISLGIACVINMCSLSSFSAMFLHQGAFEFIKIICMFAFMFCMGILILNVKMFKQSRSSCLKEITIEILAIIITMFPLFIGWSNIITFFLNQF